MIKTTYTVYDIANYFLSKESMEQKKLQKLCYYAQAWSFALLNRPIIDGEFEAWVHGPVNRTLWNDLRDYGYVPIEKARYAERADKISDPESLQLLESVWTTFGEYTGWQLERLTHTETPWLDAREGYSEFQPSREKIKPAVMQRYYRSIMASEDGVGE